MEPSLIHSFSQIRHVRSVYPFFPKRTRSLGSLFIEIMFRYYGNQTAREHLFLVYVLKCALLSFILLIANFMAFSFFSLSLMNFRTKSLFYSFLFVFLENAF